MASSYAVAGWHGVINLLPNNDYIRFTNETIDVPQGVSLMDGLHVGQRVPGVYKFDLIKPSGSISFPLMVEANTALLGACYSTPVLEAASRHMLRAAIQPFTGTESEMPRIATTATVYRGDVKKILTDVWSDNVTINGSANGEVDCTLTVKATYGTVVQQNEIPTGFTTMARALHFNEFDWSSLGTGMGLTAVGGQSNPDQLLTDIVRPKSFNLTVSSGLIEDDSYNPCYPQALVGFTMGQQTATCEITLVGGYTIPNAAATPQTFNNINIGDLYSFTSGLWTSKSYAMPGPADLAVTSVTLSAIAAAYYCVEPGSLLLN